MSDFGEDDILALVGDEDSGRSMLDDLDHLFFLDDNNNNNNDDDDAASSLLPHPIPSSPAAAAAAARCDYGLSTIGQIEQLLLNEDDDIHFYPREEEDRVTASLGFLSDILLDSPLPSDPPSSSSSFSAFPSTDNPSPDIDVPCSNHNATATAAAKDVHQSPDKVEEEEKEKEKEKEEDQLDNNSDDADPIAKKRKRQLRNRDAAVRSRERKKMYIKDLEIKSRYYESECRRLGMLLQCYLAENHALRLSLHNTTAATQAFDASTAKQESAVLLLESLLLGSLLWLMGIMALLILPRQLLSNLEVAGAEKVGCTILGSLASREAGMNNVYGTLEFISFMTSKRCRGSRRKMRCFFEAGSSDLHECFILPLL